MTGFSVGRVEWSEAAAGHLRPAMESAAELDALAVDVWRVKALLFAVRPAEGGEPIAHFALRIERLPGGASELVVIAAGGSAPRVNLYRSVMPAVATIARQTSCATVRGHACREAIGRKLLALGFKEAERVYRYEVPA